MFSTFSFNQRQLPNGKWRIEGSYYGVRFAIDSKIERPRDFILDYLESKSTEHLINNEGYIVTV